MANDEMALYYCAKCNHVFYDKDRGPTFVGSNGHPSVKVDWPDTLDPHRGAES